MHETAMTALGVSNDKSGAFERADSFAWLNRRKALRHAATLTVTL